MAKYSIRRAVAVLSALCVWVAATLQALQMWGMTGGVGDVPLQARGLNVTSTTPFMLLDEAQLKEYWSWKRGQLQVDVGINLFTTAGLLGLSWSVLILSPIFGKYKDPFGVSLIGGDADLPHLMVGMFFFGAICPAYSLAQSLGLTQTADVFSQQEGLPVAGLQAMHMAYQIFRGEGMYMFSTQFVFIPIGLCILAHLSFRTGEMSQNHGVMGIVTAFFGFITFFLELGTFNLNDAIGSAVGSAFGVALLFYGIVMLPLWTIWLGVELHRLKKKARLNNGPPLPPKKGSAAVNIGDTTTAGTGAATVSIAGNDVAIDSVEGASNGGRGALLIGVSPVAATSASPVHDTPAAFAIVPQSSPSSAPSAAAAQQSLFAPAVASPAFAFTSPSTPPPPPSTAPPSLPPQQHQQPVVVPALAPPPQSRHVLAATPVFAAPPPAATTPPFTAAASPPSPTQFAVVAPPPAQPVHHGSSDIDFLSGGISSSFIAVDHAAAAPSSSVVPSTSESFDIISSPAVPATSAPSMTPSIPANPFADPTCGNCEQQVATVHCTQCGGDLCDGCNASMHTSGLLKKHKRTPLGGADALQ